MTKTKGFSKSTNPQKNIGNQLKTTDIKYLSEINDSLSSFIETIPDPRVQRTQKHIFKDILIIAILAVIGGAEGWEDMENYGHAKKKWLEEFLELPNGIPSDDTFRRLFERIDPKALEKCLEKWIQNIACSLEGEVVPIDGKCMRGSYDRNKGLKALHVVTAWASEQRLTLGQVKVDESSNEITAIPALLELLDITGAIVTISLMGTQTNIVKLIREKKADYVVSLKGNNPTLFSQVKEWFKRTRDQKFERVEYDWEQSIEKGHNRTEKRQIWVVPLKAFGDLHGGERWSGLQTIVMVERTRHLWNKTTKETQFYLTSLPPNARIIGRAIRKHWTIENQVHWILDVTFKEDECRIRSRSGAQNVSILRKLALNALNQEKTLKRSLKQKRKHASMNDDYMIAVLNSFCQP